MKPQSLDLFKDAKAWVPVASGEATLNLSPDGAGLRMDFDFKGGGGFVVARTVVRRTMPDAFTIGFKWRGKGPVNHLELKLVDQSGTNVWRYERRDLKFTNRWCSLVVKSRDIEFAWGPAGGGAITELGAIEIAIVAKEGGAGSAWISDFWMNDDWFEVEPRVMRSRRAPHWLKLNARKTQAMGGLVIDWKTEAPAEGFRVLGSSDGKRWRLLHELSQAGGARSYLYMPGTVTRWLKLESGNAEANAVRMQPFEFSRSIEAFWHSVAKGEPRGWHPRWLHREQSLWTPIGTPHGPSSALMNEQGMVEISAGSFSLEPFVWISGELFTWADAEVSQSLRENWQPVPAVLWSNPLWTLQIQAESLVDGTLRITYRLENRSTEDVEVRLFVALRPFQVTPPWQHFRKFGGVAPIHRLDWKDGVLRVNDEITLHAPSEAAFGALKFSEGSIVERLAKGEMPGQTSLEDPFGFASGAFACGDTLVAGTAKDFRVATSRSAGDVFDWTAKLQPARWQCANGGEEVLRTMETAAAHILITRSGAGLQPGPRRYTRSWIRDGAIMSAALLRMGCWEEVREFIDWYAPNQREDGFVPCCVDCEGVDWLVEHDSHGQLIALIADYCRITGDDRAARLHWERIERAVEFIRQSLDENGLMPVSVSHEGYLAQPVHSYWDGFWTWRGLRDAVWLAAFTGKETCWQELADHVGMSLQASIQKTRTLKMLDYIPGSVEWADFDPTATANAITLLDVPAELDRAAMNWTFEKYLIDWRHKRTGELPWTNYTPYEIRIIGAFVQLGRREAALELLQFFLSDRRPLAWNQWPEIAWRDPLAPGHIGDVPHTWISAEYVLAVRSLFVFEDETQEQLVLAAGIAADWMRGEGVQLSGVPTIFGALSYHLKMAGDQALSCEIGEGVKVPKGGIVLRPPLQGEIRRFELNGLSDDNFSRNEVIVRSLPARILIQL